MIQFHRAGRPCLKRALARFAAGAAFALGVLSAAQAEPTAPLLIRDARVIDFSGPEPAVSEHVSVLVRDGRVAAVGPEVTAPAGATVVEGHGRTLMPGLVDMHVHIWDEAELGGYLARGITTIRNASGMPFHLAIRDRIAAGELVGPRLITTGPILNGHGPNEQINHMLVDTPEEARKAVQKQYAMGFRRLKVYSNLSRGAYDAIREEAQRLGMTMMGHPVEGVREPGMPRDMPFNIKFEELLDDHYVTLEHMESIVWHGLRNELDEDKARILAKEIAAAGVPVDPTLLAFYGLMRAAETKGEYLHRPGVELLNPFIVPMLKAEYDRWSNEDVTSARRYMDFYKRATKIFQEEGVLMVTGTDAGIFSNVPGDSEVTELRLLTESGLTPYQALQAATWNPARALHESDRVGRVAPGYRADLMLVDGDPLADATLAGSPDAVVAAGRLLSRDDLRALRAGAANPPLERTETNLMAGLAAQGG